MKARNATDLAAFLTFAGLLQHIFQMLLTTMNRLIFNALRALPMLAALFLLPFFACKNTDGNAAAAPPAAGGGGKPGGGAPTAAEGYVVKSQALTEGISASGTILPAEETDLHPEASGRVVGINLPEGRAVRRGDLLLKIFDEDLQTQLKKLETQLRTAEITEQRLGELLKVKGVSQQEYDLAALAVQNLKNEMELVRVNLRKTELRAPYDGLIGLRNISPGAYITPATSVATIRSVGALKLDFYVPEKYSPHIRVGQNVQFAVQGLSGERTATIVATEQSISEEARNLRVRAAVKGATQGLLPGAFAEVSLTLGGKTQALMIPSQAIVPQARNKSVWVCRGGKAASVPVKTGVRQAQLVEITEGLQAGDTVVVTGVLFLKPEGAVKFSKID